jgi:A/G-specific adenine glycosylase
MGTSAIQQFQADVYDYYDQHGRHDLAWRLGEPDGSFDPYKILVSELMLQQTQVVRVTPKYAAFLKQFPTVAKLAAVPLGDVLRVWTGLGYNRRAKYLHLAAQHVMADNAGQFPRTQLELTKLPGVGMNTAGAIMAYAYNEPVVFIETNIRTVFIHHFFHDQTMITDDAIRVLVTDTLDQENPRLWYWALMDYGSHLKRTVGNLSTASTLYTKQSQFQGSRRQIRGQILRLLGNGPLTISQLIDHISDERLMSTLSELVAEGLVHKQAESYTL